MIESAIIQHNTEITVVQLLIKDNNVSFIFIYFLIPSVFKITSLCLSLAIIEKSESVLV
jgi:hypothetical protein